MPLTADQRAMLELMLERGQSYDDLASLLDLSEAEVRTRARAALTELGGADPDRNVGLTDYLLGQADPIGRADAVRHLKEDPDDHRLASDLLTALEGVAPGADLPRLPGAPAGGRFLRRAPAAGPPPAAPATPDARGASAPRPRRLSNLSSSQTRLMVALGSGAVILIAVVLAVAGAFGGGDEGSSDSGTTSATTTTGDDQVLEQVRLRPTDGGDASGSATFGITTADQAFVDIDISKLEPAPNGKGYVLWGLLSQDQGLVLATLPVDQSGSFSDRSPIDASVNQFASRIQQVDVSLVSESEFRDALKPSIQAGNPLVSYAGESVLRGDVQPTQTSGG